MEEKEWKFSVNLKAVNFYVKSKKKCTKFVTIKCLEFKFQLNSIHFPLTFLDVN